MIKIKAMNKRIILNPDVNVKCPSCGHEYGLNEGITEQTIDQFQAEYDELLKKDREVQLDQLKKQAVKEASAAFQVQINDLQEKLEESNTAKKKIEEQIKKVKEKTESEVREELKAETKLIEEDLDSKNKKIKEYKEEELKLRKENRELKDKQKDNEVEIQRRLDEERKLAEQKASDEFKLREAEYKKKIDDAQKANEALKKKLDQGSQQLQGEVLELELEQILIDNFHFDKIEEVKKGKRGADVIQNVFTRSSTFCGKIIWEAKRAENWSGQWISKLKDDQIEVSATIAVIVTTVFPFETTEPFVLKDGIWIVKPFAIRPVAEALRSILIEAQRQKIMNEGKNEKMEALYDYLCSPQFIQKLKSIVDIHSIMREELEKEKAASQKRFKKREAQLEKLTASMMGMCGELQGIAGNTLPQLETIGLLPEDED